MRIAVIGAGAAGMTATSLLARKGHEVALFEAHKLPGGCASWFRRSSQVGALQFDAGATVLDGFSEGGICRQILESSGLSLPHFDALASPQFVMSSGRRFSINPESMVSSLAQAFPQDAFAIAEHFPKLERLSNELFESFRGLPHLPLQTLQDMRLDWPLLKNVPELLKAGLPLWRRNYLQLLEDWKLSFELRSWIEMNLLITLQCRSHEVYSPFGALGTFFYTLDAGTFEGGMRGLFEPWMRHLSEQNHVQIKMRSPVEKIEALENGKYSLQSLVKNWGPFDIVISAIPRENTQKLFGRALFPKKSTQSWGAFMAYVAIEDHDSLPTEALNVHSQWPREWAVGGGEVYLSFSKRGDLQRAPGGFRCVNLSTHVPLEAWQKLPENFYKTLKEEYGNKLLRHLHRYLPGVKMVHCEFGSPSTFERYTRRFMGGVGGIPLKKENTLFQAPSQRTRLKNVYQIGDTSFPGQSVMACILGGAAVVEKIENRKLFTVRP